MRKNIIIIIVFMMGLYVFMRIYNYEETTYKIKCGDCPELKEFCIKNNLKNEDIIITNSKINRILCKLSKMGKDLDNKK